MAHIARFYHPSPLLVGETVFLVDQSCHHLVHVLRLKQGEPLFLFNDSAEFSTTIVAVHRHQVAVRIDQLVSKACDKELTLTIDLYQGLIKRKPMNWLIEKAVELGVKTINPVISDYCQGNLVKQWPKWQQHGQNISIQATQQCGRCYVASVSEARPLTSQLNQLGPRLLLDPRANCTLADWFTNHQATHNHSQRIALFIGPEGGFSQQELEQAEKKGVDIVTLGPTILRAETAAIASLSCLSLLACQPKIK